MPEIFTVSSMSWDMMKVAVSQRWLTNSFFLAT